MLRVLRTPWHAALSPRDLANAVHRSVVVPVLRRRARRSAIAALEGMADLLLDDIGVSRHDIPKAVDGMLARDFPSVLPEPPAAAAPEPGMELRRVA